MYIQALAADYDGTIATDGLVDDATLAALETLRKTGRRLILVTGRELPDLKRVFSELKLFERIVAENGALLYNPATEEERSIADPPPNELIAALKARKVDPLSVGRSIVATWEPHQTIALEVIRQLGLELQIIFNKGAVMILPPGINKATGLEAALEEMQLSALNVVGVGDAENDHAFLHACGGSAAVANALPMVKETADFRLSGARGAGVAELIDMIMREDGRILPVARHGIRFGKDRSGAECCLEPYRGSVLIAGSSGIGKSTLATALTERMAEKHFEFCVFDPEGDYLGLEHTVPVGDAEMPPQLTEVEKLLEERVNVVVNTQALSVEERPSFFAKLLPAVSNRRAKTGRPHWLLIDEAHHLLPASREDITAILPNDIPAAIFITVHPDAVSSKALETINDVIALGRGDEASKVIAAFCRALGVAPPKMSEFPGDEEVLLWNRQAHGPAVPVRPEQPVQAHKRHTRKYAEGKLGEDASFYFKGPEGALNLRAQNLMMFLQIAEGVDDRTFEHHLRAGDYSKWFRTCIKDDELAREAESVERDRKVSIAESRRRIAETVTRRYTAPATSGME